ncbi:MULTISPECIES: GGDEF domain-containing protein [unclassified Acinetobacter]|uniref:GGDEF domain-containing protein n=1 Tax=unclassified Acinetobacter TaxID=196816 RepID=UPI0018EACDE4|nr:MULTISPECIES: diguanylate cyclase [unclassified Acinetobacter]MBJ6351152.1 GGDEF domain-containing protein [Acinetobacter sp. c1]MBM0956778.1 GGDEF domain-containing protein [Acinetobacter sp. C13]
MVNRGNVHELLKAKEEIEYLVTLHTHRYANMPLPHQLEKKFWCLNLERTKQNISKFLTSGILTYLIFILLVLPTDYLVIGKPYITLDFIHCLLSAMNIALALLLFWIFAKSKKLSEHFYFAACSIVFFSIITSAMLLLSVGNMALKNQSMLLLSFLYMLGFILSGIKPLHMLYVGLSAAILVFIFLNLLNVNCDYIALGRALFGTCILGFSISTMLISRERSLFLNNQLAELNEQILRIEASELLHLSQQDALTNISNRRTFDEMFDFFYYRAKQEKRPLAVLFIDIDFFKNYNDFYGHQMGDKVISSIAAAIKNSIRHVDFVARYGGEEFVVLLPKTPAQGAYAVAANIYKAIERQAIPHAASLVSKHVTISLGFTVYTEGFKVNQEKLIHAADQALYRAKQLGRNQIYYQPLEVAELV